MIFNTYIMVIRRLENFLEPLEFRKHPQKQLVALTFDSEIGVKIYLLREYEIKQNGHQLKLFAIESD